MGPCGYVRTSDVALVMIIKDVIEGGVGIAFESRIDVSFTGSLLPALTMSHIRLQCELCSIEGHAGVALRFPFHLPFSLPLPVRSSTALLRPLVTTLTFRTNTGRTQPEREENEWRRCRRLASGPFWDHRILLSRALSLSCLSHTQRRVLPTGCIVRMQQLLLSAAAIKHAHTHQTPISCAYTSNAHFILEYGH